MSEAAAPLVLTDGDGVWMTSSDGRRLLDATAGLWFCHAGYGRRGIADAAHAQLLRLHAYSTFGDYSNEPADELADRLSALAPGGPWKVLFTSGGSDGVETAVKYARHYWQALGRTERTFVLSRRDSYHGMHTAATQISGIPANRSGYGSLLPDTRLISRDDPQALQAAIDGLGAERVAAFVCEPIIGAGGVHFPAVGYLRAVAEICRRHGILFVVDEVTTGMGRAGAWFASQNYGLEPDLLICAKGLTSGYLPLGAVLIHQRVTAPYSEGGEVFRHGYTYSGHAAAAAAALANLDHLRDHDLLAAADRIAVRLPALLDGLDGLGVVQSVRTGPAAMACVQLNAWLVRKDPSLVPRAVRAIRDAGVLTRPFAGGGLQISPALCVTDAELEQLAAGIEKGLAGLL
ncbi:aminotransferase class III-fold pyridoxal phosphate-dependent enzyme [Streptomyces caniscabiei]|uniref:aminotransferase family protein n=1 Tax=Streptomyces caniscabiei TaxID=2746961 RepID=UPI0029B7D4CC|nr:aminotransferase class III-fold pyridoxal phosphate-dependent enzyme [Streptomyces caniscabiei]MDX2600320.1 aminotransferase class III-fold pyridoxal phosphate-dependent enzyme [Streptomyces caniscabiei]